ncbi:hypothetical protein HK097_007225 [Rhizophlyctis rosea]|uniref:Uncharacterized protein n=1 Tax=Rhizophlyctis rosea TaxID=64517 RepID=A0AAD5SC70_9FUNG|nr:hypothetical protein HK097_007225 [Rhizophlyctis rosea]
MGFYGEIKRADHIYLTKCADKPRSPSKPKNETEELWKNFRIVKKKKEEQAGTFGTSQNQTRSMEAEPRTKLIHRSALTKRAVHAYRTVRTHPKLARQNNKDRCRGYPGKLAPRGADMKYMTNMACNADYPGTGQGMLGYLPIFVK